jgi:hypothetical protein
MNRYGHTPARRPAAQLWAVGETVKVGFLTLHIVGRHASGDWQLTNRDGTRRYMFTPHEGIRAVDAFTTARFPF